MPLQDRSSTLAALVAAKEAEAAAVREQLSRGPVHRLQSTGSGAPTVHGGLSPLSAAVSLPQPVQHFTQPLAPASTLQVGWHAHVWATLPSFAIRKCFHGCSALPIGCLCGCIA